MTPLKRFRAWDRDYKMFSNLFTVKSAEVLTFSLIYNDPETIIYRQAISKYHEFSEELEIKDHLGVQLFTSDICYVEGLGNCEVCVDKFYGACFRPMDREDDDCAYPIIDSVAERDLFWNVGNTEQGILKDIKQLRSLKAD